MENNKRDVNLDIIRIIAFMLVVLVHFMFYIGIYDFPSDGQSFLFIFISNFLTICGKACIPLFLLLTGVLQNNVTIGKKYFYGFFRICLTYFLCSIFCIIMKKLMHVRGLKYCILDILNYQSCDYAWYIAMYLGLYLIIPFLNMLWNSINEDRTRKLLILFLSIVTISPSLVNSISNLLYEGLNPIPEYWSNIYPITYFYLGKFICEKRQYIKTKLVLPLFVIVVCALSFLNIILNSPSCVHDGLWLSWGGFECTSVGLLIFLIVYSMKNIHIKSTRIIETLSKSTLAAYLVSCIFDRWLYYGILNPKIKNVPDRLLWIPVAILIVAFLSLFIGMAIQFFTEKVMKIVKRVDN